MLNYRRFDGAIEKINAANDAGDKASPFYSAETVYNDDKIKAIYDLAKQAPDPLPAEKPDVEQPKPQRSPKNKITADNYLEKFEEFKKKLKPDVDAIKSGSSESAAARERLQKMLMYLRPTQYNANISEYAKKYYTKCIDFIYDVMGIRRRGPRGSARTSEYQYLRQALEILKSGEDVQKKRERL